MVNQPDEIERLVHEALEQLEWNADSTEIAERVKRLNLGLPIEDEFTVLCGWLGQCNLIHKLGQQQYPKNSRASFQVPDLIAEFKVKEKNIGVCIEVKSSNKNVLSFTPEYFDKLNNYGKLVNLPVLVAWKNKYGIWMLFPLELMKIADKNHNVKFEDAIKNNLLSILTGDFTYSVNENAGLHIRFKKVKLLNTQEEENGSITENWHMIIDKVCFTDGDGNEVTDLSSNASNAFHSFALDDDETHTDTHITKHFVCKDPHGVFAHMALVDILNFRLKEDDIIHWRQHLGNDATIESISSYRAGIDECLKKGIIRYVILQQPEHIPDFIPA